MRAHSNGSPTTEQRMEIAMVNDQIVPIDEAKVSGHDRAGFFGDGVYEVAALRNGKLFVMDRHMARLEYSLREMDMLDRVDLQVVRQRIDRAVAEAGLDNATVYWHITRGAARRRHDYGADWQPNFFLTITEKRQSPPATATAITQPDVRWKRCNIKSLNLLPNIMAKHAAAQAGAYEAIFIDDQGLVTEGSSSSILMIKDGQLRVPPLTANILPGITRQFLLEAASPADLEICEQSFTLTEALAADELIMTSSTCNIVALTQVDGKQIGLGQRGPCTQRLAEILTSAMHS